MKDIAPKDYNLLHKTNIPNIIDKLKTRLFLRFKLN